MTDTRGPEPEGVCSRCRDHTSYTWIPEDEEYRSDCCGARPLREFYDDNAYKRGKSDAARGDSPCEGSASYWRGYVEATPVCLVCNGTGKRHG